MAKIFLLNKLISESSAKSPEENKIEEYFLREIHTLLAFVERYAERKFLEIRLAFLSPADMIALQKQFRQKEKKASDVLCFEDTAEYENNSQNSSRDNSKNNGENNGKNNSKDNNTPRKRELSGDIALCPKVIAENALRDDITLAYALAEVILHALLHLIGEDHRYTDASLWKTQLKQKKLLEEMKLSLERIDAFWKTFGKIF